MNAIGADRRAPAERARSTGPVDRDRPSFPHQPALDGLRRRGARSDPLSLRVLVGLGWVPRRRHVLRALGIPDHVAAHRRVGGDELPPARSVLGPAHPSAAPRAAARAHRGRALRVFHRALVPARSSAGRWTGLLVLRRELAVHRLRPVVLRALLRRVAAPAPLVARDRGAVLPGVADRDSRLFEGGTRPLARPRGRVRRRHRGLDAGDGRAVFERGSVARVLRNR